MDIVASVGKSTNGMKALLVFCLVLGLAGITLANTCTVMGCNGIKNNVTLVKKGWTGIECHEPIPKNTIVVLDIEGNSEKLDIYLLDKVTFDAFRNGVGVANTIVTVGTKESHAFSTNHTFSNTFNGGVYFVIYSPDSGTETVSYNVTWILPFPKIEGDPCYKIHDEQDCANYQPPTPTQENCCVWCTNPCRCMPARDARQKCYDGWSTHCNGVVENLTSPTGTTAVLSYAAVILFLTLVLCLVSLFVFEVFTCIKKRQL